MEEKTKKVQEILDTFRSNDVKFISLEYDGTELFKLRLKAESLFFGHIREIEQAFRWRMFNITLENGIMVFSFYEV